MREIPKLEEEPAAARSSLSLRPPHLARRRRRMSPFAATAFFVLLKREGDLFIPLSSLVAQVQ